MCLRCDGYSEEEVERCLDLAIRVNGWTATQISDDGQQGWTYTLGMNEELDHPDLIIIDAPIDLQGKIVHWLATMICEEGHLDDDAVEDAGIELLPVHPEQLTGGLIAQWSHRYRRFPDAGDFLQVLPPKHLFCACHAERRRRLDAPPEGPAPESA
jgi:hypothetical protein